MKATFGTFWHGNAPSAYEVACLASFARHGYDVTVYSYGPAQFPAPVLHGNASDIASQEKLNSFIVNGRPCLAHFSDYFRFQMFLKTDHIWTDTDIVLLRDLSDLDITGNIYARERDDSICTAFLKLKRDEKLDAMIARVDALAGKKLGWGQTGPRLLSEIYGASSPDVLPPKAFYPITIHDFYKFLLPEFREECERKCEGAYTLHLWNHVFGVYGVWKDVCPPEGSFLHEQFKGLTPFASTMPARIMRISLYNALVRVDKTSSYRRIAATGLRRLLVKLGLPVKPPKINQEAWRT